MQGRVQDRAAPGAAAGWRAAPRAPRAPRRPRVHARVATGKAPEQEAVAPLATESGSTTCPFLASLAPPPSSSVPWYRRISQLLDAPRFQDEIFASSDAKIVTTPSQIGFPSAVIPGTAEMVKAVFTKEGELSKTYPLLLAGDLISNEGLLFMGPEDHRHLRAVMAPAFTPEAVAAMAPEIVAIVERTLERWAAAGGPAKAYDGIKRLTFEVILGITMGRAYPESMIDRLHGLYTDFSNGFGAWPFVDVPFTRYGRAMAARRVLMEHFTAEVRDGRAALERGEEVAGLHGTMLQARDAKGERLSDFFLAENLLGLLFAGHDTTSTTLTNLVWTLHLHPEVMEKLREEQAALVAKHGPGVTAAHLRGMKYCEAVIKEQMRYQPIATAAVRAAARDFEMGGYKVEKDSVLYLPLARLMALDPRWAGETGDLAPGRFNPDRWLAPAAAVGPANDWQMPFGHGPRYCLGAHLANAEAKAFLAVLAQRYSITVAEPDATEWVQRVGPVPTNGLPVIVTPL